jgi:hypothetical protein
MIIEYDFSFRIRSKFEFEIFCVTRVKVCGVLSFAGFKLNSHYSCPGNVKHTYTRMIYCVGISGSCFIPSYNALVCKDTSSIQEWSGRQALRAAGQEATNARAMSFII